MLSQASMGEGAGSPISKIYPSSSIISTKYMDSMLLLVKDIYIDIAGLVAQFTMGRVR